MTASLSPAQALVALRHAFMVTDEDAKQRVESLALDQLDAAGPAGAAAIVQFWEGVLDAGADETTPVWLLLQDGYRRGAVVAALDAILLKRPMMAAGPLKVMLAAAVRSLPRPRLAELGALALARTDLDDPARLLWSLVGFGTGGEGARGLLEGHDEKALGALLDDWNGAAILEGLPADSDAERASRAAAIIRKLGPGSQPEGTKPATGPGMRPGRNSDAVHRAIRAIETYPDASAADLIREAIATPSLAQWHPALRHALATQAKVMTDSSYASPLVDDVVSLLAGGPPVSVADLRAIVVDELRRLGKHLVESALVPWQDYWNLDENGIPTNPRIENAARNTTMEKLGAELKPYRIPVAYPEVARRHGTRVDIFYATGAGFNLPIEAKRHFHKDLWTTAEEQLQGYMLSEGAAGVGVLLVFWFGSDWRGTRKPPSGTAPLTAASAQAMLEEALPVALRGSVDVVVLDVSRPDGGESSSGRDRRLRKERDEEIAALAAAIADGTPAPKPSRGRKAHAGSSDAT